MVFVNLAPPEIGGVKHRVRAQGQTIVEILVGLSVIVILSSLLILYSRTGELQASLFREAERLTLNIRRAQDLAALNQELQGRAPCGYGVHFDAATSSYVIFADLVPAGSECTEENFRYDAGELFEVITFAPGLRTTLGNTLDIVFLTPPLATTTVITPSRPEALITLTAIKNPSFTRQVKITQGGQITIVGP